MKYHINIISKLLIFLFIPSSSTFSAIEILNNPFKFQNILCSGNGGVNALPMAKNISCTCYEGYVNEPDKKKEIYLNGKFLVQCTYKKKSRFTTLFYSLCLPFGIDFIYLGRWRVFCVVFCLIILTISLNIIMFYINYKMKVKNKEDKINNKNKLKRNDKNDKNENRKLRLIKILNILAYIGLIIHLIYIIVVVILHILGKITDYYGVETENDLNYLFQRSNYDDE